MFDSKPQDANAESHSRDGSRTAQALPGTAALDRPPWPCQEISMTRRTTPRLYDPAFEHDSCGFGLIAQIGNRPSTWLVDQAFTALGRMAHRGGVNADGVTGDGSGMLLYRAHDWLRALAAESGIVLAERFCLNRTVGVSSRDCWMLEEFK